MASPLPAVPYAAAAATRAVMEGGGSAEEEVFSPIGGGYGGSGAPSLAIEGADECAVDDEATTMAKAEQLLAEAEEAKRLLVDAECKKLMAEARYAAARAAFVRAEAKHMTASVMLATMAAGATAATAPEEKTRFGEGGTCAQTERTITAAVEGHASRGTKRSGGQFERENDTDDEKMQQRPTPSSSAQRNKNPPILPKAAVEQPTSTPKAGFVPTQVTHTGGDGGTGAHRTERTVAAASEAPVQGANPSSGHLDQRNNIEQVHHGIQITNNAEKAAANNLNKPGAPPPAPGPYALAQGKSLPPPPPPPSTSTTMKAANMKAANKNFNKPHFNNKPPPSSRPLSPYNLFYRYERTRLIQLRTAEQSADASSSRGKKEGGKGDNSKKQKIPSSSSSYPPCPTYRDLVRWLEEHPYQSPSSKKKRKHTWVHGVVGFMELNQLVVTRWKALDDKTKKPFNDMVAKLKWEHYRKIEDERRMMKQSGEMRP